MTKATLDRMSIPVPKVNNCVLQGSVAFPCVVLSPPPTLTLSSQFAEFTAHINTRQAAIVRQIDKLEGRFVVATTNMDRATEAAEAVQKRAFAALSTDGGNADKPAI